MEVVAHLHRTRYVNERWVKPCIEREREDKPPTPSSIAINLREARPVSLKPANDPLSLIPPPGCRQLCVNVRAGSMFLILHFFWLVLITVVGGLEAMSRTGWGTNHLLACRWWCRFYITTKGEVGGGGFASHTQRPCREGASLSGKALLAAHMSCHGYLELICIVSSI